MRDIAKEFDLEVVRLFMLSAHYRNPVNFSRELLEQASSALDRLYNARNNMEYLIDQAQDRDMTEDEKELAARLESYIEKFEEEMEDDINTAGAIGVIFDLVREINTNLSFKNSKSLLQKAYDIFSTLTSVLGLVQKESEKDLDKEIEELIEKRQQARKEKNWAVADKIRDELKERGIILEDTPQGVRWYFKKS